ncbi:hypothetical protein MPC1_14510002 [Methylocella tundrae]|nr:hypothetical protein MPC1_14510002 [Methylocella tundrae]
MKELPVPGRPQLPVRRKHSASFLTRNVHSLTRNERKMQSTEAHLKHLRICKETQWFLWGPTQQISQRIKVAWEEFG